MEQAKEYGPCLMNSDKFEPVRAFEKELCEYTGAKFAVTCTSCTTALLISLSYKVHLDPDFTSMLTVSLPKLTYVGVAASVKNAGFKIEFRDEDWQGEYELSPFWIWDAARRFRRGMYRPDTFQCLSFHATKILGFEQGGAILHDDEDADRILRKMRFDGRTEGVEPKRDTFLWPSFHAYMWPSTAAELHKRLLALPDDNPDLPRSDYSDLSLSECFQ